MRFPWQKEEASKEAPKADDVSPQQAAPLKAGLTLAPIADSDALPTLPKPSSVFEFGPQTLVGMEFMRGICTGDDPDAIQACTWSIEPLQGKPKEKKHQYRIEF